MSEVFVSTNARRACPRGVVGSTMGVYPRGTGSNPVEGNGHFLPSHRRLYLSQRRIQTGARTPTSQKKKKKTSLIFFCAPACGTQQANVREQRSVNARTSVPHVDSSTVSDVYPTSGLRLTQKSEVSAWTFVEV